MIVVPYQTPAAAHNVKPPDIACPHVETIDLIDAPVVSGTELENSGVKVRLSQGLYGRTSQCCRVGAEVHFVRTGPISGRPGKEVDIPNVHIRPILRVGVVGNSRVASHSTRNLFSRQLAVVEADVVNYSIEILVVVCGTPANTDVCGSNDIEQVGVCCGHRVIYAVHVEVGVLDSGVPLHCYRHVVPLAVGQKCTTQQIAAAKLHP